MGGVPSLMRGEIVAFNLAPPGIARTPVEELLGDTAVSNVLKVPKVRNENWERAKPAFKPLLEEALQIRADIRKKGIFGAAEDVEQQERLLLSAPLRPMHHCRTLQSAMATWSGKLRACDADTLASALSALNAPTVGAHTALVRRLVMIFKLMGKPESLLQRWSMSTLRAVVGPGCSNHDKAVLVHDLVSRFFPDEAGCDGDSPLDAVSS